LYQALSIGSVINPQASQTTKIWIMFFPSSGVWHFFLICKDRNLTDLVYVVVRNYSELNDSVKFRVFDVLVSGLSCLAVHIERILPESCDDPENAFERKIARNALKVHLFLLKWFMALADKEAVEAPAEPKVRKFFMFSMSSG
jgi:hypothetical protein